MENELRRLKKTAVQVRRDIIEATTHGQGGGIHVGPALSATDIVTALYFKIMQVRPEEPWWEERDRFIISKGHAYAVLYAALAEKGFFPREELLTMRAINSRLQGHPAYHKAPGVDMTSGSLGNGLSCGLGIAMAMKKQGIAHKKVYVMLGDGECQEGMVWEAFMAASHYKLDNLTVVIDNNGLQIDGKNDDVMSLGDLAAKLRAFGFDLIELADGNDLDQVLAALNTPAVPGKPRAILAHTVKGKGVSFMENQAGWHGKAPSAQEREQALKELEG